MFGINAGEFLVLAVIALLVLGPDKLPQFAADAARFVRQVRRMASDARAEVTRELGPEFRDISLEDLDPRRFVSKHLLDDDDLGLSDNDDGDEQFARRRRRASGNGAAAKRGGEGPPPAAAGTGNGAQADIPVPPLRPPYDPDAT